MEQQAAAGPQFRLLGVPVRVDPSFFVVVGLFAAQRLGGRYGLQAFASWFVAVFVSLLVHELGHAVAFRRFELRPSITLYAMGGLTSARGRMTWGRSLVTSLAGPLTGIAFGLALWWVREAGAWPDSTAFARILLSDLLFVNIAWGLVNLLPLSPLDGGQSFEALLNVLRVKGAARKTALVSVVVAAGGVAWGLLANSFFLVLLFGWLGWNNVRRLQAIGRPA